MSEIVIYGSTGRIVNRIQRQPDGRIQPARLDAGGELFVENLLNDHKALAVEGSYFVAQTPTPGTGITLTSATGTSYSDTNGIVGINNLDSLGQGLQSCDIILDYVKVIITAAGTAGTDSHVASRLDIAARASAGSTLVGKNVNGRYAANDDVADIHAGAITIAAASNQVRNLGRAEVRKAAAPGYIVGDVILFTFGTIEKVSAQAITPTTAAMIVLPMPQVIIPPGWSWVLNEWMVARTAAQSAEVEVGYIVR